LACGPRGGEVAGDLGPLRAGEEGGEGEDGGAARWGQPVSGREGREVRSGGSWAGCWAEPAHAGKGRGKGVLGLGVGLGASMNAQAS
jgi:hypothetical protein